MKKILFTLAVAACSLTAQAQLLKSHMLDGYKEGDKLEKSVYAASEDPIQKDTWCGVFYQKGNSAPGPVIGKELSYEGYLEKGPSVKYGGFPAGKRSARMSVYSLNTKSNLRKGTVYVSMLINLSKLGNSNMTDIFGVSPSYKGGKNRADIYVAKDGESKMRFGVGMLKLRANGEKSYSLNQTHLVVLKLDYKEQKVSLFVNPALGAEEPVADIVVEGTEGTKLNAAINGLSIHNRSGYEGNIGNFRWAKSWDGIVNPEPVAE